MLSNQTNLVDQEIWDKGYEGVRLQLPSDHNQVRPWYEKHIPRGSGRCLEIGCFPGQFLAAFGELGYELNGIDLTPRTMTDMVPWLKACGYKLGQFHNEDFFQFQPDEPYDIVSSFGFIEHFPDWEDVLFRHAELVKKDGYLVVTTPNFRGVIQRALHFTLDRANYDRHIISSMNPMKWKDIIQREGFEILEAGYFSEFSFWTEEDEQNIFQKGAAKAMRYLTPILAKTLPHNHPTYAPFCGLIARRR